MGYRESLNSILAKLPQDLSNDEIRYLIDKVGYLSAQERNKFQSILSRDNLIPTEISKYEKLQLIDLYFSE